MAKMIPPDPPLDERGMRAERDAYLALRDQLSDDFTVLWSMELLGRDATQSEVDFLIVHPEGMLIVECKGGGVYRTDDGRWVREHRGRTEKMDESPWEQADKQRWMVEEQLEQRARKVDFETDLGRKFRKYGLPIPHGHAAAFPFADRDAANLPAGADEKIAFDSSDFDDIEPRIREALEFWGQKIPADPLDDDEFDELERRVLLPEMSVAESIASRVGAEQRKFARLTSEQAEVVRSVADEGRVLVEGGAGTGKSLLALEAARTLADDGRDVLLTCFNRKLRDVLQRSIRDGEEGADRIDVQHFHGLCHRAYEALDRPFEYPEGDKQTQREFWHDEAPMVLLEALEADEFGPWEALVVDEAQDFTGAWWEILQAGLADDCADRVVAFHDPTQDLFDRSGGPPAFDLKHYLPHNFRNTTEICRVCNRLHPDELKSHPRTPNGESPTTQNWNSRENQFRAIERQLDELVDEEGLDPSQIVVLTPRTKPNSVLADHDEIAGLQITEDLEAADQADDKLLHASIGAFKGLERDVVIFADVDPDHERCSRQARYVAASRAIHRLYVFQTSDWLRDAAEA